MKKFLYSFRYAFNGIAYAFKTQLNFKVHSVAGILVCVMGIFFKISVSEWLWVCSAVGGVMIVELLNTAIEMIVDVISPEKNQKAGAIKDVAAAAVLISAIFALIVGMLIFIPKMISYVA